MKKFYPLFLLLLFVSYQTLQAQLPDFYKKYYTVRSVHSSGRAWDQDLNNHPNNVTLYSYHGNDNQKWAIMPMYAKADNGVITISGDYIIASLHDGDVMGINSSHNLRTVTNFDGNNNKIFRLVYHAAPNIYMINSPHNVNRYLDMNLNDGNSYGGYGWLVNYPYHGNSNQQFRLNTSTNFASQLPALRSIVRTTIPTPPAPTSFSSSMVSETAKTFRSETVIPYAMVKQDGAVGWQVEYSPYYRLVRSQYYKLPEDDDSDITYLPGENYSRSITTKRGMKSTSVTEVSQKLNVSFTASAEVGFKVVSLLSAKASASISTAMELTTKNINSFEETNETTITITYSFAAPVPVRLVTYQLVDYYELYRQDGTLVTSWDVMTPLAHRVQYPAEENYGARTSGAGVSFTMEDGAVIPIFTEASSRKLYESLNKNDVSSNETFNLEISPNPTTSKVKLTYNPLPEGTEINVSIYSPEGKVYKNVKLQSSREGNVVDVADLSSGLYLVKVVAGKYNNVLKLIKQ